MKGLSLLFVIFSLVSLMLFFSLEVYALNIPDKAGTSGLAFLKLGVGARASGMGEAFTAISGDIFSLYWNPAGIAQHKGMEFAFMHNEWFQDISLQYAALCFGYEKNIFGIGLTISQVRDLERREEVPTEKPLSYFDTHDLSLSFSWGRMLNEKLDLGLSTKFLYEKIDFYTASGLGFDLGGVYHLKDNFKLGAVILNLGPKMKFEQEEFSLPSQYKLGFVYSGSENYLKGYFNLSLDIIKPIDNDLKMHLGGEYTYKDRFILRGGYQIGYDEKNLSLGLGLNIRKYAIDYAFVPFNSDLGSSHRFSINLKI